MPTLKTTSDRYLGFRHFLIAGVVIPILFIIAVSLIGGITAVAVGSSGFLDFVSIPFVPTIAQSIVIYLAVLSSARSITKKFVVPSPNNVIVYSTIWYVCFAFVFFLIVPIMSGSFAQATSYNDGPIAAVVNIILVSATFFVASKNFIKNI